MDRETAVKLWREVTKGAPDGVATGREPYRQTHRLRLETQAATNYANELLARAGSGWRLAPLAMPAACPTPRGCRDHGCHGECLPPNDSFSGQQQPAQKGANE